MAQSEIEMMREYDPEFASAFEADEGSPEPDVRADQPEAGDAPVEDEPEFAAEKPESEDDDDVITDIKRGRVPLAALEEERLRRKHLGEKAAKLDEQVQDQSRRMERMEQIFQRMVQEAQQRNQQPQAEPEPELVDFEKDPARHLYQRQEMIEKLLREQAHMTDEQAQMQQRQLQQQRLLNQYAIDAGSYAKQQDDFLQAYNYLADQRYQYWQAMGYAPEKAMEICATEEQQMVADLYARGIKAPEGLYRVAQAAGYRKAEVPEQKGEVPAQDQSTVVAQIDREEAARKANASLKGGGNPSTEESLSSMADLDDKEFDAAWAKLERKMRGY